MRKLWIGFSVLAFSLGGCASGLETDLTGSWYGDGPDGDQCFVFCGDGRLFSGDRPCSEGDAGDFGQSYSVSFTDDAISFRVRSDRTINLQMSVDGDTLTYTVEGTSYTIRRVAEAPFCSDPSRTLRTFE